MVRRIWPEPSRPDCGLVEVNEDTGLKLCKDVCWRLWNNATYTPGGKK